MLVSILVKGALTDATESISCPNPTQIPIGLGGGVLKSRLHHTKLAQVGKPRARAFRRQRQPTTWTLFHDKHRGTAAKYHFYVFGACVIDIESLGL